jgi:hypothetical protein
MQALLNSASGSVRSCLLSQVGTIATRGSCTGPWQYSLDFQVNWRPTFFNLNRRLTISVVTQNFLRGLDQLFHGQNLHGWGLATRPDPTLLYVTGFDSTTHTFNYTVNGRFGATYGSATAFRPPFQVGIQMRMAIGPDRQRQMLDALRAGNNRGAAQIAGQGGFGGSGAFRNPVVTTADVLARIQAATPNPAQQVLDLKDSLRLDSSQLKLLEPLRDTVAAHNQVRMDSLKKVLGTGRTPNFQQAMPAMGPLFAQARTEITATLTTVRAILTPEQWAKLPDDVKDPQTAVRRQIFGAPPGQGQGQGRQEGARPRP